MIKGGRDPFFLLGQPLSLPFSSLSHSWQVPGHPMPLSHCLLPLQPLDTSGRAGARGKAADAGQSRALERLAEHLTVDAASPDHLEPPPCASRGASPSTTRHHASPFLPLSVLPVPHVPRAARARQCVCKFVAPPGARPAPSLPSRRPTPPPRAPKTTPRSLPWLPEPLPRPPCAASTVSHGTTI